MCKLPFSFPVFYYCAIKPEIPYKQYKTINMLLRGVTMINSLKSVDDMPFLDSTPCSAYASGERPIPEAELDVINNLNKSEIVERIKKLPLQSYEKSATRLVSYFTHVSPLDSTTLERLLELYDDKEHIEDFLAEAFLISLKCPPFRLKRLSNLEKRALELGDFKMFSSEAEQASTQILSEENTSSSTEFKSFYDPQDGLTFDYCYRRKKLNYDVDLDVAKSYIRAILIESIESTNDENASFYITEDAFSRFMNEFASSKKAILFESFDEIDNLIKKLNEDSLFNKAKSPLCLIEVPLDLPSNRLKKIEATIVSMFNFKSIGCYGIRRNKAICDKGLLRVVFAVHPTIPSDVKPRRYKKKD